MDKWEVQIYPRDQSIFTDPNTGKALYFSLMVVRWFKEKPTRADINKIRDVYIDCKIEVIKL